MTETVQTAALPLIEAARATQLIRERLVATLNGSGVPELADLALTTPSADASDNVCLVFVGQYNAGKSSLITCLTGMDLEVGSNVTTSTAETYQWFGHLLVDTPGVRAGTDVSHDVATDRALDVADAVVFVLTPEGFDDTTAQYFLQLLTRLRSGGQLVVSMNKARSEDSDRSEILADLRQVCAGIGDTIPLVWTEARDWLTADTFPSPSGRRERSNVPELAGAINELAQTRGAQMRLATPLRELSRHVRRALDQSLDDSQRGGLDALDALSDEVEVKRDELLQAARVVVEQARRELATALIELGPDHDPEAADAAVAFAQQRFVDDLNARADRVLEDASRAVAVFDSAESDEQSVEFRPDDNPAWPKVRASLLDGLKVVSRNFQGANARPGGIGHRIVTKAWHAAGGKFKPWGAVKAAEGVGRAAKFGGVAVVVGEGAVGIWSDYRANKRAGQGAADLRAWTTAARQIADETVDLWSVTAEGAAHAMCDEDLRMIGRQRLVLLASLRHSDESARTLTELDDQILSLLAKLSADQ